jgi:circadian clock protein KaiB
MKAEPDSSLSALSGGDMEGDQARAEWDLRLYVAGGSERSVTAVANLRRICETYLQGRYRIEVVDLLQNPRLSREDQIVAIPTLVRRLPRPVRKLIGDLSDTERTLVGMQLRPARTTQGEPHG